MRQQRSRPPAPAVAFRPFALSLVVLLLCLSILLASVAGLFTVGTVKVVGANLPESAIIQASDVEGKNIFRIRTDQIVARVEQRLPNVAVSRIDATFPGQITIYATVRVPLVAWQTGGGLALLDEDGRVIGTTATTALPVISGAGAAHSIDPAVVRAVDYAVRALPPGTIAGFQVQPSTGLIIVGTAGWTADAGSGSPQTLVNRVAILKSVLDTVKAQNKQLQFIDLRYRVPYLRYVGT